MVHPQRAYYRDRAQRIARGAWRPWADPAHVRGHVQELLDTGTYHDVAQTAHVGAMTVWEIAHQARPVIKAETAQALLDVNRDDIQPRRAGANRSMWQLRSLLAMGHTTGRIATALSASRDVIAPLIRGQRATISTGLRHDIDRLWDAWWDKQPPRRTPAEKAAACQALQRAAINNWPCPAALDEDQLDLPGYTPTGRWRYALGAGTATDDPLGKNRRKAPEHSAQPTDRAAEPERQAG